tara:strand:+ start:949 stop:1284 length:336 start_codon:yes stop_codon:yes gene_type:complete
MDITLKIEKTDVKIYTVQCTINLDDLIKFVDDTYGSYQEVEVDPTLDPETYGDVEVSCTKDEYYQNHVENYIDDQDPDLLFTDNCHDNKDYQLESEECSILSFTEIKETST